MDPNTKDKSANMSKVRVTATFVEPSWAPQHNHALGLGGRIGCLFRRTGATGAASVTGEMVGFDPVGGGTGFAPRGGGVGLAVNGGGDGFAGRVAEEGLRAGAGGTGGLTVLVGGVGLDGRSATAAAGVSAMVDCGLDVDSSPELSTRFSALGVNVAGNFQSCAAEISREALWLQTMPPGTSAGTEMLNGSSSSLSRNSQELYVMRTSHRAPCGLESVALYIGLVSRSSGHVRFGPNTIARLVAAILFTSKCSVTPAKNRLRKRMVS